MCCVVFLLLCRPALTVQIKALDVASSVVVQSLTDDDNSCVAGSSMSSNPQLAVCIQKESHGSALPQLVSVLSQNAETGQTL